MNTNEQVVSSLRQLLAARGIVKDSSDWNPRLILYYALRGRSAVLKAKLDDRKSRVSHFNKQTLDCIPMSKIDLAEAPCIPPTNCFFTKSKDPIPAPLSRYLEIDNVIGNKDIDYVEWGDFRNRLRSRYELERTSPAWTLRDLGNGHHLYIYNFIEKFATVTSVFEHPMEVFLYPDCQGVIKNRCSQYMDFPFVIDDGLLPLVLESAYTMLVQKTKEDDKFINQNDDTSNAKIPVK